MPGHGDLGVKSFKTLLQAASLSNRFGRGMANAILILKNWYVDSVRVKIESRTDLINYVS